MQNKKKIQQNSKQFCKIHDFYSLAEPAVMHFGSSNLVLRIELKMHLFCHKKKTLTQS